LTQAVLNNESYEEEGFSYFVLPKDKQRALKRLLQEIQGAKKRITLMMYALSHPKIIEELLNAHNRGVHIELYLDRSMIHGSCKEMVHILKKGGIKIAYRIKPGLCHHKSALIDNTYIFGSVNWSKAGFTKNEETLIVISNLSDELLGQISRFISDLNYYSNKL